MRYDCAFTIEGDGSIMSSSGYVGAGGSPFLANVPKGPNSAKLVDAGNGMYAVQAGGTYASECYEQQKPFSCV